MTETAQAPGASVNGERDEQLETELLRIVRTLAEELHPHLRDTARVTLDSELDRDLGLDSLGRAELLQRLDKTFKVRLPDHLLSDAATPRDFLEALEAASPAERIRVRRAAREPERRADIESPVHAETFIEVLGFHTDSHPERPHIRLWQDESDEQVITYADLDKAARRAAFGLIDRGVESGDRVAIMLPTGTAFFQSFFGALYAGAIPVPLYPPFRRAQVEEHLRRQAGILRNAGASILVIDSELRSVGTLLFGLSDALRDIVTIDDISKSGVIDRPVPAEPDTVALIQYTSGSTGEPKGVVLTHANLLANIRAMGEALEASSNDVFASWLPLYHDMGLIGAWLGSLYYGALAIIMSPLAFIADPGRWLRAITRHRATLSAAPNFAFELCCRHVDEEDKAELDLSSIRLVVNGAEPVSPVTIERFTKGFADCGFRPEMMGPVYGLAENSVGVAFPPLGREPVIDRIEREPLSRDSVATPASEEDATALCVVACGRALPRHEFRIVDDASRELPERHEGRLQFRGPSATSGYFRNPEKNRGLFDGDWLETGDLAYVAGGDLYITGRIKDIIIKAGRNLYPQEIEEMVGEVEGVRKGCVAAISSTDPETATENLVLVVETRLEETAARDRLRESIAEACTTSLEMPADVIELVPPHTVPKTSSGKIRRSATKELYEAGELTPEQPVLWIQLLRLGVSGVASRTRRLLRRARAYIYAAYWWSALVIMAAIVWPGVLVLPRRAWRYGLVHRAARVFLFSTGASPRVVGNPQLPPGGAVLIANHSSYLDPLAIAAVSPQPLRFIAKQELAGQRVAGPFLRRLGALFARRAVAKQGVEDVENQQQAVASGARIVTFPEGTLTRMPGLLDFHLGAFTVAAKEGVPVIPVTITGTRSILRGGQWFPRPGRITVHIDDPVHAEGTDFDAALALRDRARTIILERCGEPDLARERVAISPDQ